MRSKITLLAIACLFTIATTQAQKIVALHNASTGEVQYFNDDQPLQAAYDVAQAGDTLYLPGGSFTPPSVFEKKLIIYGAGYHPDATTATYRTLISGNVVLSDEADGFHLEGVVITGEFQTQSDESVNDIVLKRCHIPTIRFYGDGTNPCENVDIIENTINNINTGDNLRNSTFMNNILGKARTNFSNVTFLNNLFLYNYNYDYYTTDVINYAATCLFKNNIFMHMGQYICDGSGSSTWVNNIFCTDHSSYILGLDPVLQNNYFIALNDGITYTDILVNYVGDSGSTDDLFSYDGDYHLKPGLETTYLGDDATQVGIYGGYYPFKEYSIPVNPHISSKSISGESDENGTIQVNINVHAQDQ